ncbi:RHS repeat-associated core domain-containing protein [Bacteroides thetaiotaomicron]|nr:RHS repeat-associated core domain-containing protein [Bacteroides thetaiotaomicron]
MSPLCTASEASHRLAEAGTTDISVLHSLAYSYEYDKLNRMISKRLPGCAPIYMVYDRRDRLVLSQDGTRRTADTKKWSYFLYDSHDRVIESGEILLSAEQTCGELQLAAWENEHYLPSGTRTPLQYTVYDNYKPTENVTAHPFVAAVGYDTPYTLYPSGLTTSTKTRLLGTDDWLTETIYYDDRSRVIQTLCHYPEKGLRYRHTAYDFTGNVLRKQDNIGTDILETVYTYDDRARLLTKANTWNGRFTDKITYVYDALGRLTGRNYGDKVSESLSYNIRGWLTGIESQHFSQTLHYVDGVGVPCYNGNISSMIRHSGSEAGLRGYKFTYDGFSRLKDAIYGEGEQLSNNLNRFNEQVTGYDKNGNILGLLRYGQTNTMSYGLIDNLNLVYNGNQLESVNDNATGHVFGNGMEFKDGASKEIEYEYDANGNLTKDLNKKIADIQYNCLNLPEKVQFEGGNSISYLYAADGTKLRTTYKTGNATTITDYCGNAIYENGVLIKVLTEDGYITVSNNQFHYFIQDHQGNNRVVVAQNGTVEEVNDYYPFGGLLSSSLSNNVQPYKYNGKELNRDNGLDWYDYGARMYDASLGRWHMMDPMAEKYYTINSYVYCINNPVGYIDPNGLWAQSSLGWFTDNTKDIGRFLNMMQIEIEMQGNISKDQLNNFIYAEYKGIGGRLSDGSTLLSEVNAVLDKIRGWDILEYQKKAMLNEIDEYTSFVQNDYIQQVAGLSGDWKHFVGPSLIF